MRDDLIKILKRFPPDVEIKIGIPRGDEGQYDTHEIVGTRFEEDPSGKFAWLDLIYEDDR